MSYHPPQRATPAFIFSLDRWIRGTFHLAKLHAFEDHLARDRAFFPLTEVALGQGTVLAFLALRASAAHLVVPEGAERELLRSGAPASDARSREVSCYLERVAVHGILELPPGVRTSDYLANRDGFIALRGCRIVAPLPGRPEPHAVVFVNAGAILAVAEEGGRVAEHGPEAPGKTDAPVS